MPFATGDNIRIMSALRLTANDLTAIDSAMAIAEPSKPLLTKIQSLLTEIEETEELLKVELNNPNFALVQADVLTWQGDGSRGLGYNMTLYKLIKQLGSLLNLTPNLSMEEAILVKAGIPINGNSNFFVMGKVRN
jgi:hypothetical protein